MNYSKIIISIYLIMLFAVRCSKNSTEPEIIGEPEQFMVINIQPINLQSIENGETTINSALRIDGKVVADTLPSIESVTVNESPFMVESGFEFGEKTFTIIYDKEVSSIENINIEVKTSIGIMFGSVANPDTITNISFDPALPMQSNQKLTVTWDKGKVQYYRYLLFSRRNYFQEITTTNKIEIPATQFRSDGMYQLAVYGVNGPVPKEGTKGNMSGDGVGFLYFINNYQYFDIIVGD
jgi:hypothetical protein